MTDNKIKFRALRCRRVPANDRVEILGLDGEAWTVNWSSKGFCLMTFDVLHGGDRHHLEFPERYTHAVAEVVWTKELPDGCLAGFEFQSLERRIITG